MGVRGKVTNPPETLFHADSNTLLFVSMALILMEIIANLMAEARANFTADRPKISTAASGETEFSWGRSLNYYCGFMLT